LRSFTLTTVFGVSIALLAACSDDGPKLEPRERPVPFHPGVELLERYDSDHDGTVTRAEMEAGLKAEFAAADKNHDGRLDEDETRAVNEARWGEGLSTTSTLVDWNHDGFVDFQEFANTARSLFDQLDRNGDGKLTPDELHPENKKGTKKPPEEKPHRHGGGN
jgi:Ca2+-binding EF-hand superfamily protein